ncbi:MAG TPA: hypothetical protein VJX68_02400 [Candidatus Binatus sp.]|nr:hypothetical protein [Candidatus Binatus sp.]HKN12020.1 hypothetical protein [Candidatus Binatus sp.]
MSIDPVFTWVSGSRNSNVAFYNMVVRVLVPVGVELEPGTTRQ